MKFQVGLLDKSKVIEKMISHCLHYFMVDLHFFTDWEGVVVHTKKNQKFDILFVDWDMSYSSKRVIDRVQEQLPSVPTVLMYRKDEINKLNQSSQSNMHHKALEHAQDELHKLTHFPHRVEKPLNPKHVREVFTKLIPEITEQTPHPFLKYPKSYDSKLGQPSQQPSTHLHSEHHQQKITPPPSSLNQNLALAQSKQKTQEETLQPLSSKNIAHTTQTSIHLKKLKPAQSSLTPDSSTAPQAHAHSSKKIDKSTLVLSETTKNDFAPLPIKSSGNKKEDSLTKTRLTEEQVLQVLNKYKDSLEFTKIMETTLTQYAKEAVQSFLDPQQAKNVMKETMQDFQGANQFKQQVETEVKNQIKLHLESYLKKDLALQIKSVLQEEIQKILSE